MFFSIIIPFFNKVDLLEKAVESVLRQTIQDFEIILVDDGSTEEFSQKLLKNKKIKYFYQENKGPASARNLGIDKAKGKYITFLDADDLFLEKKLEEVFLYIEKHRDVKILHTSYELINFDGDHIKYINSGEFKGEIYKKIIYRCPIATPTVVIKRDLLKDFKFDEEIRVGEDTILWTKICKNNILHSIDMPLTKVRIHGKNSAYNISDIKKGGESILKKTMEYDDKLNIKYKLKKMSCINYSIAKNYLIQKKMISFMYYLLKGFILYPVNIEVFRGR